MKIRDQKAWGLVIYIGSTESDQNLPQILTEEIFENEPTYAEAIANSAYSSRTGYATILISDYEDLDELASKLRKRGLCVELDPTFPGVDDFLIQKMLYPDSDQSQD